MKTLPFAFAALCTSLAVACGGQNDNSAGAAPAPPKAAQKPSSNASAAAGSAAIAAPPPATADAGSIGSGAAPLVWQTDEFQLAAGEERYLCFSKTLDQDIVVGAYSNEGRKFVHHIIFARTLAPEPDGFAECNTGFRMTWNPLYITGAGASKLEFPSDAGHTLTKGTQLLAQLHLLNQGDAPVKGSVAINMYPSSAKNPRPVNSYIFGSMDVHLPAGQTSQVVANCDLAEPIKLIAAFPHMHLLGKAMHFEVGPSYDAMKEVFARDPFDFGNQHVDSLDVSLAVGDKARLTCTFDNPNAAQVDYGESTLNEMCYLIGFAVDRANISGCDLFQKNAAASK